MDKSYFEELFYTEEVIGKIIMEINELEFYLGVILTRYYTAQERFREFQENIIDRFSLAVKIEILKNLKLPKQYKSKEKIISSLEKIKKIRNLVAHSHIPSTDPKFEKLIKDPFIIKTFKDFPKNFNKEVGDTKKRLRILLKIYSYSVKKAKI